MGHRFLAAIVGLFVAGTSISAWSRRHANPAAAWAGALLLAVYGLQIVLGAVTVWADFPAAIKALHLSLAPLVWINLVVLATIVYSRGRRATTASALLSHQQA
jgi:heme A synthase